MARGKPAFSYERNEILSSKPAGRKALARLMLTSMVRTRKPGKRTADLISTGPCKIVEESFKKVKKNLAS